MDSSPFLVRAGVPITPTISPRRKCSWLATKLSGSSASLGNGRTGGCKVVRQTRKDVLLVGHDLDLHAFAVEVIEAKVLTGRANIVYTACE